ncbi:hypothetical protein SKAU_G00069050 [Synaphobranchus kaupii]|uniref:Uncharacterized protein n=1 Tax=Synaphobranchus kaupii TaxID=118154 RepID=A0A9Q1G7Y7_SYNKA|nr:hypothetical protein SKAU_G00069050 [Synaphobranchus kaupii]
MNWDSELSSVLSAAEGSVAKIRRQLAMPGKYPKDIIPERDVSHMTDFQPPPPPQPLTSLSLNPPPQWEDLARIQGQLQSQNQAIESLTKTLRSMESERHSLQLHLQALQEELRRLRGREEDREREREGGGVSASPGVERRMEQWKREVGMELSSLRGHITRAVSLTHQEESFSSKMQREEIEQLRREVDQLKQQLRRQEEEVFHQQSESREARRQYERSCKTLESLTDSYRTHSLDLTKTISQHQSTQEDICQLRLSVSELKDEVRELILRDGRPTPVLTTQEAAVRRDGEHHGETYGSDSEEDFSPTPSLGEVSSDDLSWAAEGEPGKRQDSSSQLNDSDEACHRLEDKGDEDSIDLEGDLEALSYSPAELSLSDL